LAREIGAIRAFVFDLDGTLVEIKELKALSYASAAAEVLDESGTPLSSIT
jgi:phosphoglycolate phosphatase-like HAD superfamily hydrolase